MGNKYFPYENMSFEENLQRGAKAGGEMKMRERPRRAAAASRQQRAGGSG
jgi:hypothetical protein